MTFFMVGCNDKPDSELGHNENSETSENMKDDGDAHGEEGHDEGEEEGGHSEEEGVVELTKQQAETIGLEMKPLEERNLGNNIKVTGALELFPQVWTALNETPRPTLPEHDNNALPHPTLSPF